MSIFDQLKKLSIRDIIPPKQWRELRKAGHRTGRAALRAKLPWIEQLGGLTDSELTFEEISWLLNKIDQLARDPRLPAEFREQLIALLTRVLR